MFSAEEKRFMLSYARAVIGNKLGLTEAPESPKVPALFEKSCGMFVSLHIRKALRGCIGNIEPVMPLLEAVRENSLNAAFGDPRFTGLSPEEFKDVDIEISVLTPPRPVEIREGEDLLDSIKPGVHGVILENRGRRATFLPQVWEQLPGKESFLGHLCRKGGMDTDCWKDENTVIRVYEVECFSESE